MIALQARHESLPLAERFAISRGARHSAEVVVVTLREGALCGRGECVPYPRYGESIASVLAQIESLRAALADGCDNAALQSLLPPGAARNALDCALWDLRAKRAGRAVWALAELPPPGPLCSAVTVSMDRPAAMQAAAARRADCPLLKIKLGGEGDLARLAAVRRGAPAARLIVDANEGWDAAGYRALLPALQANAVALIEQPLPAGEDAALAELPRPIPVCADESCHDRASLAALAGRYDAINIKLDKSGGLSEALALRAAARAAGLQVMVGCMVASSLAMAPAVLVAQGADVVDLDGPLLLAADREHGLRYEGGSFSPPAPALWG